jgi:hypothetical protein
MERIKNNPAVGAGIVSAVIAVAVSFGAHLNADQVGTIMGLVCIVLGVGVRAQVTPTRKLRRARGGYINPPPPK